MCVFLGRAMKFFWPQSRGRGRSPPSPPLRGSAAVKNRTFGGLVLWRGPSCHPTNSVKALKEVAATLGAE